MTTAFPMSSEARVWGWGLGQPAQNCSLHPTGSRLLLLLWLLLQQPFLKV